MRAPGSDLPLTQIPRGDAAWRRVCAVVFAGACALGLVARSANASPELDAAVVLVEQKQFALARAALEKIVTAAPENAAACHQLGRVFAAGADKASSAAAVEWSGRAIRLEPGNAVYLSAHGRALLRLAGQSASLSSGLKGRDVLEQAVALDPAQLDAREALFQFYQRAPWPLGSRAKAEVHLAEICRRDRARGSALLVESAERAVQKGSREARDLLSDRAIAAAGTPEAQQKLRALRTVLEPAPAPFALARTAADRVFLSDAAWAEAKVGWGQPARNRAWFDEKIQDGVLLTLRGQLFEKGLHAHSPSRYVYALDDRWQSFTAVIGLRDGAHPMGSAVFIVRGDGRELYRSPVLRVSSPPESVTVDITGVKQLELLADGAEGHNHHSWAIWAQPEVRR